MLIKPNLKTFFNKLLALILNICLVITSLLPFFYSSINPNQVYAADNSCSAGSLGDLHSYLSTRVGGVSLDEAAVFLADMTDITGAYYDADQDRIVFVGQKNTTAPKFDKDDLAVAI